MMAGDYADGLNDRLFDLYSSLLQSRRLTFQGDFIYVAILLYPKVVCLEHSWDSHHCGFNLVQRSAGRAN